MRDKAPKDEKGRPTNKTMLDVAKKGLSAAVQGLGRKVWFGITGLGGDRDHGFTLKKEKTWGSKMKIHPAVPRNLNSALKFIRNVQAKRWSNDYDAIAWAFQEPNVDTIYLYGDGGTSKGTFVARAEQLEAIGRLNRFRKIMIHTVEVPGKKTTPKANIFFLKELASRTKGIYKLYEREK